MRHNGFITVFVIILVSLFAVTTATAAVFSKGYDLPKVATNVFSNYIQPTVNNVVFFVTSQVSTISQNQELLPSPSSTGAINILTTSSPSPTTTPTPVPSPLSTSYVPVVKCLGADGLYSYVTQPVCDEVSKFWDEHSPAPVTAGSASLPESPPTSATSDPTPTLTSSGPFSPGTVLEEVISGGWYWSNANNIYVENVKVHDGNYALTGFMPGMCTASEKVVSLIVGGSITGENKASANGYTSEYVYYSYGGSSDTWNLTLTPSHVNSTDFGFALQYTDTGVGMGDTNYLKATNFGFSIPNAATINGILLEIEARNYGAPEVVHIDHVRITVYYTY